MPWLTTVCRPEARGHSQPGRNPVATRSLRASFHAYRRDGVLQCRGQAVYCLMALP